MGLALRGGSTRVRFYLHRLKRKLSARTNRVLRRASHRNLVLSLALRAIAVGLRLSPVSRPTWRCFKRGCSAALRYLQQLYRLILPGTVLNGNFLQRALDLARFLLELAIELRQNLLPLQLEILELSEILGVLFRYRLPG